MVRRYNWAPHLRMSDHRPVSGTFDVRVIRVDRTQLPRVMFEVEQELGLDIREKYFGMTNAGAALRDE
jgi:hypothetical protein